MIILTKRGVFLPRHRRETLSAPIRRISPPARLFVPLFLPGGEAGESALCPPCAVGAFDVLARLDSGFCFVSPCAGEWIETLENERGKYAVIEPGETEKKRPAELRRLSEKAGAEEIIERAARAGIVDGRGRALCGLLSGAKGKVRTVYADCIEDEPYGTVKSRRLKDAPEAVAGGLRLAARAIGAEVGDVKVCASLVFGVPRKADDLRVERIYGEYPVGLRAQQRLGEEKGLLLDGVSLAALWAASKGEPETETLVTVAGEEIGSECIASVLPGTTAADILRECGGPEKPECLVFGDAMTGEAGKVEEPVTAGTRVLLAYKEDYHPMQYCISCGRCMEQCPQKLRPSDIVRAGEIGDFRLVRLFGAQRCFGCGVCDYCCPMGIDVSRCVREAAERTDGAPVFDGFPLGYDRAADRGTNVDSERGVGKDAQD